MGEIQDKDSKEMTEESRAKPILRIWLYYCIPSMVIHFNILTC